MGLDRRGQELRKQPDRTDQQRLVDQIEDKAVPSDEDQRVRPVARREARQPSQHARGGGKFRRREAQKHGAEPWQQWNIVVGARIGCGQADPPQDRVIEGLQPQIDRCGNDKGRHNQRQQRRQA